MQNYFSYPSNSFDDRTRFSGFVVDDVPYYETDDAISAVETEKGFTLFVSIADAAYGVAMRSPMDHAAYHQGHTHYHINGGTDPMLPKTYGEDRLSLVPGKDRPTVTAVISLSHGFEVTDTQIIRSVLQVPRRFTYAQFAGLIDGGSVEAARIHMIAEKLLRKRREAGALLEAADFDVLDGKRPKPHSGYRKAQIVIQEFMIAANRAVAAFAQENGIPILYRNHADTTVDAEVTARIQGARKKGDLDILYQMSKQIDVGFGYALYGAVCEGHFALNVPFYCHSTSPLRRFADLVTQRQIVAHIEGQELPYSVTDLQRIAEHLNGKVEASKRAKSLTVSDAAYHAAHGALERWQSMNATGLPVRITSMSDEVLLCLQRAAVTSKLDDLTRQAAMELLDQNGMNEEHFHVIMVAAPAQAKSWQGLRQAALQYVADRPEVSQKVAAEKALSV